MKMGALIYVRDMSVIYPANSYGNNRRLTLQVQIDLIGTIGEIDKFTDFIKTKLPTILRNYNMDWHVKPDNPEHIEFILNIMGDIMKLQEKGKIIEAKALLELVERVLPTYKDSEQYQLAEDLRNVIWDQIMLEKEK